MCRSRACLDEPVPPCVVKAPDRQGQRGLTLVRTAEEVPAAIEAAIQASRNGTYIVEELVEGPEVTVNAFSVGGVFHPLTVTDRLTADPPAFGVALAHAWPSELSVVTTQSVVDAARAAAEALGIENGPTYTQIRVGPQARLSSRLRPVSGAATTPSSASSRRGST